MSLESSIKDAMLTAGGIAPAKTNAPAQYGDRRRQYFDGETRRFTQEMARYSSDFVTAQVQGLDPRDPLGWGTYRLRLSNISRSNNTATRLTDDFKTVLFENAGVDYLPPGAKIVTMGSTWLAVNPDNISGGAGSGVIRRCNAVWNHLDFYGNVVSEPIIVENQRAQGNDSNAVKGMLLTEGYFNIICQNNPDTAQLNTNSRLILGSGGYRITGYTDFEQEFTGDSSSVRLLYFTARYEEPNAEIDDLTRHVAEGKTFSWDVRVSGTPILTVGQTARFEAVSVRRGEAVTDSPAHPLAYLWASSDVSVAAVDPAGNVTARAEGAAAISATLQQNMELVGSFTVTVAAAENAVRFLSNVPETLAAFDSVTLEAAYFAEGAQTAEALTWELSAAEKGSYNVTTGPQAATITCYGYSAAPLVVTVSHGEYQARAEIRLTGL